MDPNDVSASNVANPAQVDDDVVDNDIGDTLERVNRTQSEDNPKEFGSDANPESQRRSRWIAQEYHDGKIHLSYQKNPYLLSPRGLLAYDLGRGPGENANGVALLNTSEKLINMYVDRIAHINVSPKLLAKISKEDIDLHILGVIMMQQFSLHVGIKKFGDKATKFVSKELQ